VSDTDRRRWDERYTATAAVESAAPAAPEALARCPGLLPPTGRALDVACGRGTTAVWLALHGFAVDAVDGSPVAVDAGRALARRVGVDVAFRVHDLDDGLPPGCTGPYDVVVCQRFRDPALYPALAAAVAPVGLLVLTVLSVVGGRAGVFRAAPGELLAAFPGWRVLDHREGDGTAHLLARPPSR
jgi:2-polyprenyl-3-methyl-5-hydroxy-6-metoxy-1,4-benzoquinol methylase